MMQNDPAEDIVARLRRSLELSPPKPSGGTATRRIITGSDGRPYVEFVDVATGQPIQSLEGYELLESGDGEDWTSILLDQEARSILGELGPETVNLLEDQPNQTEQAFRLRDGGEGSEATSRLNSDPRGVQGNFGYVDTPRALGWANMAPGPFGMAAKVANTAINANNVQAVQAARNHVGLPDLTKGQMAGGLVGTNDYDDGLVADAVIADRVYGIGLEALTPDGRTALTPEEARKRSETAPNRARLATEQENAQNRKQFKDENPSTGIKGTIQNVGKSLGRALGWTPEETEETVQTSLTAVETAEYQGKPMGLQSDAPMPEASRRSVADPKEAMTGRKPGFQGVSRTFDETVGVATSPADARSVSAFDRNPLDPRDEVTMDFGGLKAASRNQMPGAGVANLVEGAVARSLGAGWTVNVTSGMGLTAKEKAGQSKPKGNHAGGYAVDFTLTDPKGRAVNAYNDPESIAKVASALAEMGAHGVGVYDGTKGQRGGHIHADITPGRAGRQWGGAQAAIQEGYAKAETYRQETLANQNQPVTAPEAIDTALDRPERPTSITPNTTSLLSDGPIKDTDLSPASLSNLGYGPTRSATDRERIAATLAGELHGNTLRGIQAGDPESIAEAANVLSTIENRAQSQRYASLADPIGSVLGPSNYNANVTGNVVQADNLDRFGPKLMGFVDDFYDGRVRPTDPTATHYYNPSLVEPDWGSKLQSPQTVGYHTFGSLTGEYVASPSAIDARSQYLDDRTPNPDRSAPISRVERVGLDPIDPSDIASSQRTQSSGFAGSQGSFRSQEGSMTSRGFAGTAGSARSMDESNSDYGSSPVSSSGFAGKSGSARSQNDRNDAFDGSSRSETSSGFAGNSGSARSQNAANDSYDGRSEGSRASRSSSGGFAGSAGSARSANQNNSSFDGSGSSSKGSGGFAGSSGSGRSVEGSQKGSGGMNTGNAGSMSERSKDDGVGSSKSGSSTGSWR